MSGALGLRHDMSYERRDLLVSKLLLHTGQKNRSSVVVRRIAGSIPILSRSDALELCRYSRPCIDTCLKLYWRRTPKVVVVIKDE